MGFKYFSKFFDENTFIYLLKKKKVKGGKKQRMKVYKKLLFTTSKTINFTDETVK